MEIKRNKTILNFKDNINHIRAEADSIALEIRFHKKEIHEKYLSDNETANQIFKSVEQSRVEANGSFIFKGIKSNISNFNTFNANYGSASCIDCIGNKQVQQSDIGNIYADNFK